MLVGYQQTKGREGGKRKEGELLASLLVVAASPVVGALIFVVVFVVRVSAACLAVFDLVLVVSFARVTAVCVGLVTRGVRRRIKLQRTQGARP